MSEHPQTLKVWRERAVLMFGETSAAVTFLDNRIDRDGELDLVLADERQTLHLLASLDAGTPVGRVAQERT